jgi:SAM-dependent methyltransferase
VKECSKSITRRLADPNFTSKYFVGAGLDIGGKPDPLSLYKTHFCRLKEVRTWDWEDGDAQFLTSENDKKYDFVHSSHCLEHLKDPCEGLKNWFRVIKQGGYLVITVPDEDLYEQGIFPSTFNRDHKWTFTILKTSSWSPKSINVLDLIRGLGDEAELVRVEQLSASYRYDLPRFDQTLCPVGESGIEFVIRKRPPEEVLDKGRWRRGNIQPDQEVLLHLNQYKNDMAAMKISNQDSPPFTDLSPLLN